jgi:hypothetical protein
MSTRSWAALVILTLMAAKTAHAAEIAVFPVQGTNLSAGEMAAIGALMVSAYAAQARQPVLNPYEVQPALQRTGSERDSARELGLREYIHVEAVRLENRITLSAVLRNQYGSDLYAVRATAMSLDDMEVVSERVASALWRRTPLEYTRSIDSVTGKEMRAPNRLFLEKIFGARFAMVLPVARHLDVQPGLLAEFDARLEQRDYFLELGGGLIFPTELASRQGFGGLLAHLGGSYYLSHANVSPYIGAGLSPRIFMGAYQGAGMAAYAHAGLMFMRESSTRLYVELQVDQNLTATTPRYPSYYDSSAGQSNPRLYSVRPTEFSLAVGLGF